MNSLDKGNRLEDALYQYLLDQKNRGELVLGIYSANNCKIFRKKKYPCGERGGDVEFDIVMEIYASGRPSPNFYVVFECKNYKGAVPEIYVNDFSAKIGRIFPHAAKGIMVISSRLQSGAEKVARSKRLGIIKYDEHGVDIVADRKTRPDIEDIFMRHQFFDGDSATKSLKFSAYNDGEFFSNVSQLIGSIHPDLAEDFDEKPVKVPYVPPAHIKISVQAALNLADYQGGAVNLERICSALSINLQYCDQETHDTDGALILGSANFNRKLILINSHKNKNRERFTLGHEIGHFCLKHQKYLSCEKIIENDLIIKEENDTGFNLERLEYQANAFASNLLLPDAFFTRKTAQIRHSLDIRDRGHGYIFVDDQPCNYIPYEQLITSLSYHFEASKQVIQIKFRELGMLTDQRKKNSTFPFAERWDLAIK